MPRHLHLDFETYSEAELKSVGAYRYANDPSTVILCSAMALDDEEPVVWWADMDTATDCPPQYWDALENPEVLIYCHNAMFEMAICQALLWKTWGIRCPALSRFRCTMSMARRAALPSKLETLAEVLGLQQQKDPKGKKLIKKFSEMQKAKKPTKKKYPQGVPAHRIRPEDDPAAFAEFVEYCRQDVRVEQEVARKLACFDEPINNASYSLDAVINARGVTVNLAALRHAQKLIDEETEVVSRQFLELTGFNPTRGDVFLKWLHSEGVHLDNLQAETIETYLEGQG